MSTITTQAWLWSTTKGDFVKNLALQNHEIPREKATHILIEVLNASVNPGDLKFPKLPFMSWMMKTPASLCYDFCGRIKSLPKDLVQDERHLHVGQIVFGSHMDLKAFGSLRSSMWVHKDSCWPLPDGVPVQHGSGLGVAGLTAYAAIAPFAKPGGTVLVVGGSGGVGTMCIQVAKALDMNVIATCSEAGKQLCLDLGADGTLDYKSPAFLTDLKELQVDIVVDTVGSDRYLHHRSEEFLKSNGTFVLVALMADSWSGIGSMLVSWIVPVWLGGPPRKWQIIFPKIGQKDLKRVADIAGSGRLRVVVDSEYEFGRADEALRRIQSGRAKGKVIVAVDKSL